MKSQNIWKAEELSTSYGKHLRPVTLLLNKNLKARIFVTNRQLLMHGPVGCSCDPDWMLSSYGTHLNVTSEPRHVETRYKHPEQ
jgi:hypothetical protein